MFGAVRVGAAGLAIAFVLSGSLGPGLLSPAVPAGTEPPVGAAPTLLNDARQALSWTDELPVDEVAALARSAVQQQGGASTPAPDAIPGYQGLAEADQRAAWRSWLLRAGLDASRPMSGPLPWAAAPEGESQESEGDSATVFDVSKSFGLTGLWTLESHGYPQKLLSAGDGATFLVTDEGILRFPAPGANPQWMVKLNGWIRNALTADAGNGGSPDVVIGLYSYEDDGPSIVVLDGDTGGALYSLFPGEDQLWSWTLTDVDGDSKADILGLKGDSTLLAATVAGEILWQAPLELLPEAGDLGGAGLSLIFWPGLIQFGDYDADGIRDAAATGYLAAIVCVVLTCDGVVEPATAAFSGADGHRLWVAPSDIPVPGMYSFGFGYPVASGDLTGDGRDDLVMVQYSYSYIFLPLPVPFFTLTYGSHTTAYDGTNGAILFQDRADNILAYTVAGSTSVPIGDINYEPYAVLDLDVDGTQELVGFGVDEDGGVTIVGRGPGAGGPTESVELYRLPIDVGGRVILDGSIRFRDMDADGAKDLVILLVTGELDDEGEDLKSIQSSIVVSQAGELRFTEAPRLLGFFDYDEGGKQGYGLLLESDQWVTLDEAAAATKSGVTLVPFISVLTDQDHNGDQIPDFLLRKSAGYRWVDGSNGRLLDEVSRPVDRYANTVVEEEGSLRVLERSFFDQDTTRLVDLRSGEAVWSYTYEEKEDEFGGISKLVDVDGDNLHEIVVYTYKYNEGIRETRVLEPRTGTELWMLADEEERSHSAYFVDARPGRPGQEIIVQSYSAWSVHCENNVCYASSPETEEPGEISLRIVGQAEPAWTAVLDEDESGYLVNDELIILRLWARDDPQRLRALSTASGIEVGTISLPEDAYLRSAAVLPLDAGANDEVVLIVRHENPSTHRASYQAMTWSPANPTPLASVVLAEPPEPECEDYGGYVICRGPSASYYVEDSVGDWDGDGWQDVLLLEKDVPVVRSGRTLAPLAVALEDLWTRNVIDLDGDGKSEIGLGSYRGELRFVAYDAAAGPLGGDLGAIHYIGAPLEAVVEEAQGSFFEAPKKDKGLLPGPSAALALLAFALVVALGRRRQA